MKRPCGLGAILAAQAGPLVQAVRHSPVEVPFHRHGAAFVACDLDQHDGGVPDAEVLGADHEVGLVVLGDNHEPVVVWHVEHAGHGGVDHVGDGVPVPPRGLPWARSIRTRGIWAPRLGGGGRWLSDPDGLGREWPGRLDTWVSYVNGCGW